MANYYGVGRSNYVRVKDEEAFTAALAPFEVEIIHDDEGRVGIIDASGDGAGFSWYAFDTDDPVEVQPDDLLGPHLQDGEVMILVEAGHVKHRYVIGYALAFNNKREFEYIDLDQIVKQAQHLGANITLPRT